VRPVTCTIRRTGALLCAAACIGTAAPDAAAQAPPAVAPAVQPFVRNWTRVEVWRYFDPPPATPAFTPGDPDTAHIGNRLLAGVRMRRGRLDATVALQYVQFGGLPSDAIGPGALGTGALYFDHSGETDARQLYLKAAHVAVRRIGGSLDLQVGRMPYTSGAERASGVPKIEAVKRQRLDSRLIGEFEWSLFQRAYDGVRADWMGKRVQVTGLAARPTQGGFEDAAGASMRDVAVFSGVVTTAAGALVPESELQFFADRYNDHRSVSARPDNTGRRSGAVDVGITTLGGHLAGAGTIGPGQIDVLVWTAGQFGSWYELDHRALGIVAETGYQWPKASWSPWVRGGYTWLSGDGDPADGTHGTFFPMLPTVRRYSQSTLYSLANQRDGLVQVLLRPRPALSVRADLHVLSLASRADAWYGGSGATQERGRIFGYTVRPSGGASGLMNVIEASGDYRFNGHWSVNGYVGVASRGPVVRTTFAGGPATFFYLENVLQVF
jgi:alginate export protein